MTLGIVLIIASMIPLAAGVGLLFAARANRSDKRTAWGLALTGSGAAGFGCAVVAILALSMSTTLEDAGGLSETKRALAEIRADAAEGRAHAADSARRDAMSQTSPPDAATDDPASVDPDAATDADTEDAGTTPDDDA